MSFTIMHDGLQVASYAVIWSLTILASVFTILRVIVRAKIRPSWGWDDTICCIAAILNILSSVADTIAIMLGCGISMTQIPPAQVKAAFTATKVANGIGTLVFSLPRVAAALMLPRILPYGTELPNQLVWWSEFLVFMAVVLIFITAFSPDQQIAVLFALPFNSFSSITSFTLAIYPTYHFFQIHLEKTAKVLVSGMCAFGIASGIVVIVKLCYVPTIDHHAKDVTWHSLNVMLYTSIDVSLVIISSCMPLLAPLFPAKKDKKKPAKEDTEANAQRTNTPLTGDGQIKRQVPGKRFHLWDPSLNLDQISASSSTRELVPLQDMTHRVNQGQMKDPSATILPAHPAIVEEHSDVHKHFCDMEDPDAITPVCSTKDIKKATEMV